VARISTLIFPIAAVFYVYLIGRYVAGALPGCLAAICFSTDPTLLAHGGLVTTDVAAAAGFLAATYHGVKFIARPDWKRSLIAGIALGLALSCKFSCIAVIPGLVLIALLRRRRALFEGPVHRYFKSWPRISRVATVLLTAFVTLWATFLFDFGRIQASPALQKGAEWYSIPNWLKSTPIPMPAIVPGFMMVVQHNRAGHSTYINGSLEAFGTVSYFPEAIILKTPAAVLVGLVLAIGSAILARRLPPMLGITLFPFAVYMLISMNAKLNLGIRHVLPAIPFLYLLLMQQLALVRMNLFAMIVTALAFIETLCLHPDYLAFFNVFAGGPRSGEKYLLDSNLDWGQDQFRLAKWLEQNAKGRIVTDRVFGNPRLREWQHEGYTILPPGSVPRGLLAVSKNEAYGLYLGVWDDADGKRHVEAPLFGLERYKRVARIGYTIDVYDLDASVGAPSR
jgi:4-amino-4-deoxy-L-arabinose transferase-like glycosyltransferase